MARERDAALELLQRLFERQLALLEARDDRLQFSEGGFEVGSRLFLPGHAFRPRRMER